MALRDLLQHVLSEGCYDEFFVNFNLFHGPCLKATLSKCLGLGIIAGSVMVKVPQITKILGAKSAQGISLIGSLLELGALTASASYNYANNFPFSSWGETLFLILQTATINFLVLLYGNKTAQALAFLIVYLNTAFLLVSGVTPMSVLWFLQALVIPVVVCSKMIQAYANYKNGSTGQLSAVTVFMLFFGSLARIFTSIQETGDPLIVLMFTVTSLTNGIIAAQMVYYWKPKASKRSRKKKKAN